MPVHDWTRVDAGTFHAFHQAWITHLMESLNAGLLPEGYYAMGEQIASGHGPDVLALRVPSARPPAGSQGLAVTERPPKVRVRLHPDENALYHRKIDSLVIRHASGHAVVAMIEIISRANKDRTSHVSDTVGKIARFLGAGVNILLIDLLPPGKHDPTGIHGSVWEAFNSEPYLPPVDGPLTLASYESTSIGPEAYVEPVAVGQPLIDMPIFLQEEYYINVPLEATYLAAYRGMPAFWRNVLEGKTTV